MTVSAFLNYLEINNKKLDITIKGVSLKKVQIKSHQLVVEKGKLHLYCEEGHSICVDLGGPAELVLNNEAGSPLSETAIIDAVQSAGKDRDSECNVFLVGSSPDSKVKFKILKEDIIPADYWGVNYFHKIRK